jgi:signal transduction histidine kinase/CheY-like chemotaxis protein
MRRPLSGASYVIAIGATALALLLRLALAGVLRDHAQFLLFIVGVAVAAWHGGLWPGLLATFLGTAAGSYFFTEPRHTFYLANVAEQVDAVLFVGVALLISAGMEAMQSSNRRVVRQRRQVEEQNRRLEEVEAALKQVDRQKQEFLATLAHELRNPLVPIRTSVQILRLKGSHDSESKEIWNVIERQVSYIGRIVDDLLDTSRIAQNKLQLRTERIALAAVVEQAVEISGPFIAAAGHELSVKLPSIPVHLEADPTRLVQVFINLLNNAAKYTERGGRISVTAEQSGREVVVNVTDNGVGIGADALPHLFDMYMQVEHSLKRSQGGLGLGLPLVRRLVHLHGGSVAAHSDGPGKGSEFTVRLPLANMKPAETEVLDLSGMSQPATKRRLLIVDDLQDSADSLAIMLRLLGHEVDTAYDGLAAVAAAAKFRPEVVLMDIGMPKLNGFDACRQIREQPWGKSMILIAQTGLEEQEDKQKSEEAGFTCHLVKPVDPAAIEQVLTELRSADRFPWFAKSVVTERAPAVRRIPKGDRG